MITVGYVWATHSYGWCYFPSVWTENNTNPTWTENSKLLHLISVRMNSTMLFSGHVVLWRFGSSVKAGHGLPPVTAGIGVWLDVRLSLLSFVSALRMSSFMKSHCQWKMKMELRTAVRVISHKQSSYIFVQTDTVKWQNTHINTQTVNPQAW